MKKIQQSFSVPFQYDIIFTEAVFNTENPVFAEALHRTNAAITPKLLIIIDDGVHACHPSLVSDIQDYAKKHSQEFKLVGSPLIVPGGEQVKNDSNTVKQILKAVHEYSIDRHSYIAVIGGGAVLDMAGFAASVAHRGVRLIRIPTTVLSQNDSGIGVKNSVNYFNKKNFLGVFDPPFAVINDTEFLRTLSDRDWRSGVAEAIKVALIKDALFFEQIETDAAAIASRSMAEMNLQIFRCAELHAEHIRSGDPFEKGSSRPLDFGHWAAHKLEQITNYELRHGEAVAIGIALDVCYSFHQDLISEEDFLRVIRLIAKLGFEFYVPALKSNLDKGSHPDSIIGGLEEFREHLGGILTIMLIEAIGTGVEIHEMDLDIVKTCILHLEELSLDSTLLHVEPAKFQNR